MAEPPQAVISAAPARTGMQEFMDATLVRGPWGEGATSGLQPGGDTGKQYPVDRGEKRMKNVGDLRGRDGTLNRR